MDTKIDLDWGLVLGGFALFIVGSLLMMWPGITLFTLAMVAGVLFLIAGGVALLSYLRMRKKGTATTWALVSALCNVILGIMFLTFPVTGATVITWLAGALAIVYGTVSIAAGVKLRDSGVAWGWLVFDGVVGVGCGVAFIAAPPMFALFLGIFLVARGITMCVYGFTTPSVLRR